MDPAIEPSQDKAAYGLGVPASPLPWSEPQTPAGSPVASDALLAAAATTEFTNQSEVPDASSDLGVDVDAIADGRDLITGTGDAGEALRPPARLFSGIKRYSFDLSIDVNGIAIDANGNVTGARKRDVRSTIEGDSTRFIRDGRTTYTRAKSLGASGQKWVEVNAKDKSSADVAVALNSVTSGLSARNTLNTKNILALPTINCLHPICQISNSNHFNFFENLAQLFCDQYFSLAI